ncbi:MAG: ribosome biogenesis GTPase YlqF, partial [Selenomonadales bacterium]|nr:ribosome biogenesis GTPase YlqF [Selenomonadales bacterium]
MGNSQYQIQWFPGHMAKTRRLIGENLKYTDIVIELRDARIPYSSKNPEIEKIIGDKPRLILLNKASLADPEINRAWLNYFKEKNEKCLLIDCVSGTGIKDIYPSVCEILSEKMARWSEKGMHKKVRAMVVGIPNVGKSSFINRIVGSKKAKVEDRPGVTLNKQWVSTNIGLELIDMPGVLWPKFDEKKVGENLAITGAIKDQILDTEELAMLLCGRLRSIAPDAFAQRYKLTDADGWLNLDLYDLFELVGRKRGFLISGGEINHKRTADALLDEFRGGKIGRISLESP